MARKRNGKNNVQQDTGFNTKFINHYFNDPEIEQFLQWSEGRNFDLGDIVMRTVEEGWKVSFSHNVDQDLYYLSLTGKNTSTGYDGVCILIRHANFDRIPALLSYMVAELLEHQAIQLPGDERGVTF